MKALKMENGELDFKIISGVEEFWQRVKNSLKIYANECFYNENLGIDLIIINEQDIAEYKLEHICSKLKEWYKNEILGIDYKIISEDERILKAKILIKHKEYSKIEKEVVINGKIGS